MVVIDFQLTFLLDAGSLPVVFDCAAQFKLVNPERLVSEADLDSLVSFGGGEHAPSCSETVTEMTRVIEFLWFVRWCR